MKVEDLEYDFVDIESCECVGMFEDEYVYDIEMDDETHTFIANNILVHNSLFISYDLIMKSVGFDDNKEDGAKFILNIDKKFFHDKINIWLDEYAAKFKVKNLQDFELERINKTALHMEKKCYLQNVIWEDDIAYEEFSYFYPKGIEIVKSSTPSFVRERIYDFIRYIFKDPDNIDIKEILKIVKSLKKEFIMTAASNIESVSMTSSCNNYTNKVIDDQKGVLCVKAAHHAVKAAALHNYILNKNPTYKTRFDLIKGGKIKYYYCKHSLNQEFAYIRSFHPTELVEKENVVFDVDTQFEKTMLSIINRFMLAMDLPIINKRISLLTSLFG